MFKDVHTHKLEKSRMTNFAFGIEPTVPALDGVLCSMIVSPDAENLWSNFDQPIVRVVSIEVLDSDLNGFRLENQFTVVHSFKILKYVHNKIFKNYLFQNFTEKKKTA